MIAESIVHDTEKGCWLWVKGRDKYGYAIFGNRETPIRRVHRFMLASSTGGDRRDRLACHTCHVRRCVNPSHLYWGTYQNNSDDAVRAGRLVGFLWGSKNGRAQVDEAFVLSLREARAEGLTYRELAESTGLPLPTVSHMCNGTTWKHVPLIEYPAMRGSRKPKSKLDEVAVAEILASDEAQRILAGKFGVSQSAISSIKRRKTWTHVVR